MSYQSGASVLLKAPQRAGATGKRRNTEKPICMCVCIHAQHLYVPTHRLPIGGATLHSIFWQLEEHCFFPPQDYPVLLSGLVMLTQRQALHPSLSSAKRSDVVTRCVSYLACELERTLLSFQ